MEDLATDRIDRLMIAHRVRHGAAAQVLNDHGALIVHTPELVTKRFDEELDTILCELPCRANSTPAKECSRIGGDRFCGRST